MTKPCLTSECSVGNRVAVLLGEDQAGDVFGRVRHLAVLHGAIDDVLDGVRDRAEDVRAGDDDFLADAEHDLGVELEVRVKQVEVLDDDAPAVRMASLTTSAISQS
jgi:hypothetical protein